MKTAGLQKADNKNQSMASSLFKKNEEASFANTHETSFETTNEPAFNFGNIKVHNSGNAVIQPKLQINQPGDQYEQEADAMADKVMRMEISDQPLFKPSPLSISRLQRKCEHCEEEEENKMQRKEDSSQQTEAGSDVSSYINSLSSKGSPLPDSTRSFFESRFGQDFSNVKIHDDADAAKSSQSVNALAYTVGNNIVFNQNQFSTEGEKGNKLLAHELTHVVQQGNNKKGAMREGTILQKAEQVNFDNTSGTTLTNSQKGKVNEERHGRIDQIDSLHANLEDIFRVGIQSLDNADIISTALQKDKKLYKPDSEVGPKEKSSIATTLIEMYNILDARVKAAPRDQNGLPKVDGIKWEANDPLGGILEAISPFGNLDFWETFVIHAQSSVEKRPAHKRKSSPKKEYVSFDENEEIVGGKKITKQFADIGDEASGGIKKFDRPKSLSEKLVEGGPTLAHAAGDIAEQLLEETPINFIGLPIQSAALYWEFIQTFREAANKEIEGGELAGTEWTLLALNNAFQRGQFENINAEILIALAKKQRDLELARSDKRFDKVESAELRIEQGRTKGIIESSEHIIKALTRVETTYKDAQREFAFGQLHLPGESAGAYKSRQNALTDRKNAYKSQGFAFDNPVEELKFLKESVIKKILEKAPELQNARTKIFE